MNAPRILVIGESCVDRFVYCRADRLAPDVPVPVLTEQRTVQNDGMAMNLWHNLKALGAEVDISTHDNWRDVTKTRYVEPTSNHMFIRVDSSEPIPAATFPLTPEAFAARLSQYDIVAISDYHKGFLCYDDITRILDAHPRVFVDTKKPLTMAFAKALFLKINTPEYHASKQFLDANPEFYNRLIVTAGAAGCYFRHEIFPTKEVAVRDVSGAGDTFFAGLITAYAETRDIRRAIWYANLCASHVVQRPGVTVVDPLDVDELTHKY